MAKTKKLNNFIRSDGRTMTVVNKGEILCLRKKGLSIKAIAGKVNRSMDWISTLIDTFGGTPYEREIIRIWDKRNKLDQKTKVTVGVSSLPKRKRNSKSNRKLPARTVSKRYTKRRKVVHTRQQDNGVQRTGKSGSIVESLRKTNEYKEVNDV